MTPVQLPEVPESEWMAYDVGDQCDVYGYTADQLRAYATEAVMAERARILVTASYWRTVADEPFDPADNLDRALVAAFNVILRKCADELTDLLTQPEQNSGR